MPTATSEHAAGRKEDLATLRSLWKDILDDLHQRKHWIGEEIRNYPTPIPRCDAQFNHLYEQQARLVRDLDRFGALAGKNPEREDYIELIGQFIASAPYTDDVAERALRSRMKAGLSAAGK